MRPTIKNRYLCLFWGMAATICLAQTYQESSGLVIIEAESTTSPLGLWQTQTVLSGYTGSSYLEFTGNDYPTGPATSPIEYSFKINQGGLYYLHLHCARERITINGEVRNDVANDCYVRVEGDYGPGPNPGNTHNDDAPLSMLQSNTKFFGGNHNAFVWAAGSRLDPGGHQNKRVAIYDFKAGETYKLVVSGRSKAYKLNRILFRRADVAVSTAQNLNLPVSSIVGGDTPISYSATEDFPNLSGGIAPYYIDTSNNALAIDARIVADRNKLARATRTFDGPTQNYDITITTLTEEDGESVYRLLIDDTVAGTFRNPYIGPDSPLDMQPTTHTWNGITVSNSAVLTVESNTATNGEISENEGTAWARGRWRQIEFEPSTELIRPPAGRVAIVADGNSPDPDDIGAIAVMFGLLKGAGLKDRLVHLSHSCDLDPFRNPGTQTINGANEQRRQTKLEALAEEGSALFGPFPSLRKIYNCRTDQAGAVNDLRFAINASSPTNPLWIIEAGEPDIIGFALDTAIASKRQYVHIISHHPANDNSGDFFTWQEILDFGINEHQIGDQNVGLQVSIDPHNPWAWALEHPKAEIAWIWDQLAYAEQDGVVGFQSNKFDCSDAGMLYWWITGANINGNNSSNPAAIKSLLLYDPNHGFSSNTGLKSWRMTYFDTIANAGESADNFDANADGESNLLEFATGQDPHAPMRLSTPLSISHDVVAFHYKRSHLAVADGLGFEVLWTESLNSGTWTDRGTTEEIVTDNGALQSVKASIPNEPDRRHFAQLQIKP